MLNEILKLKKKHKQKLEMLQLTETNTFLKIVSKNPLVPVNLIFNVLSRELSVSSYP